MEDLIIQGVDGILINPSDSQASARVAKIAKDAGIPVYAVGKIEDIYAHRGITESNHTGNTKASEEIVSKWTVEKENGFIMANYIDFANLKVQMPAHTVLRHFHYQALRDNSHLVQLNLWGFFFNHGRQMA